MCMVVKLAKAFFFACCKTWTGFVKHGFVNLYITETRSTLFLTKYDKNIHLSKSTLKTRFFSKQLKIKQNTVTIEAEF